jgi:hypothetical protein
MNIAGCCPSFTPFTFATVRPCRTAERRACTFRIEIAAVGSEGVVGLSALAGSQQVARNSYLQIAEGSARFMLLDSFNREFERSGTLRRVIDRFSRGLLESIIQSAACNRLHTIQHRWVRWLLSAQDRLGREQFESTHNVLANALGIKKTKLTVVLKRLDKLNTVQSGR